MSSSIIRSSKPNQDFAFLQLEGNVFTSGCPIYGVAALVLQNELDGLRTIYLKWEGKEQTIWVKPNGETCSAERIIFSSYQSLWKPASEVDDRILYPGSHHWPFEWNLPSALPASFIDSNPDGTTVSRYANQLLSAYGHIPHQLYCDKPNITYTVSLVVETDEPRRSLNLRSSRSFQVTQRLDLDIIRIEPLSKSVDKTFLFIKGVLQLKVTLPYGAVAFRGRSLPLRVEVLNGPKKKLETITMTVYQTLIFNAKGEMIQRKLSSFVGSTSATEETGGDPPSYLTRDLLLNVPVDTEPSITLGTLIQRHYELTVELSVFMGSSAVISLPIQLFDPHELDQSILSHFPETGHLSGRQTLDIAPTSLKEEVGLEGGSLEENLNETDEHALKKEKQRKIMMMLAHTPETSPIPSKKQESSLKRSPSFGSLELGSSPPKEELKPRQLTSSEPQFNPLHTDAEVKKSNELLKNALGVGDNSRQRRKSHARAVSLQIGHQDHSLDFLQEVKKETAALKENKDKEVVEEKKKKEETPIPKLVVSKTSEDNLEEIIL